MLKHLAARVEGRLPRDDLRDVLSGVGGAALMLVHLATPFLRTARTHWGLTEEEAQKPLPGDQLVPEPIWSWTHGVEIDAQPDRVWRWMAQLGADRAGFYSYQWLENLAGCALRNADAVHPDWELRKGEALVLHPKVPTPHRGARAGPLLRSPCTGRHLSRAAGKAWAAVSWLFMVEPLPNGRSRLLSRYRMACSADLATRLAMGPVFIEPISFAMDRRLLIGIKERAEREARHALARSTASE